MKAGIVGLPQVGKTTIFRILTRMAIDVVSVRGRKLQPNVGVVQVPDERVAFLASVFDPDRVTYATIEFVDVVGLVGGKGRDLALDPVRDVEIMVHVVRAFSDATVPHSESSIDPERDIRNFDAELILADLASVEKRLERLNKDLKKLKDPNLRHERDFLVQAQNWLESERPLREMEIPETDRKRMRGFAFLSEKPMIYAINLGDDKIGELPQDPAGPSPINTERVSICGKLEAEMTELPPEELDSFLDDYGLTESGMVRLIRSTYHLLGLISFLTVGKDECRAWTIRKGTNAQKAAGVIHTDLEKHFIRAEVAHFSDFQANPGFGPLRDKGLLRLEGKGYEVQDGDIVTVRHSG